MDDVSIAGLGKEVVELARENGKLRSVSASLSAQLKDLRDENNQLKTVQVEKVSSEAPAKRFRVI